MFLLAVLDTCFLALAQQCPSTVSVSQSATDVPADWQARQQIHVHRLAAVGFYDGNPEEGAALTPRDAGSRATWRFRPDAKIWMECSYALTSISLVRRLPKGVSVCVAEYNESVRISGYPELKSVKCMTGPSGTSHPAGGKQRIVQGENSVR